MAIPEEEGLGAPVEVVGTVGGFSCEFVRFATNIVVAWPKLPEANNTAGSNRTLRRVMITPS